MRAIIAGLAGTLFATNAMAADYLRGGQYEGGSASYNWAGVYIGAQIGYSEAETRFAPASRTSPNGVTRPTIETASELTQWPNLPLSDARATSYGGFIGYNSQWGEVVLGLELNYNHMSLRTGSTSTELRDTSLLTGIAGTFGQIDRVGEMRITDYGSARVRAGYAWNWAMPYAFAGLAVGRADLVRSSTVSYVIGAPPTTVPPSVGYTDTEIKNGAFTFGYSAGAGIDIGLFPGMFLRGEYEFVQLNTVKGMTAQLNNFRVAAAVKF